MFTLALYNHVIHLLYRKCDLLLIELSGDFELFADYNVYVLVTEITEIMLTSEIVQSEPFLHLSWLSHNHLGCKEINFTERAYEYVLILVYLL